MTAHTTFRDKIMGLEVAARAEGEGDFADLLRNFRQAYAVEARDSEACRDAANCLVEEARRIANRFENSADYVDGLVASDRDYAREGV